MKLLTKKQVKALVLYSYAHIDRLEAEGLFPVRVKLSAHRTGRVGWIEEEVVQWLQDRINARNTNGSH